MRVGKNSSYSYPESRVTIQVRSTIRTLEWTLWNMIRYFTPFRFGNSPLIFLRTPLLYISRIQDSAYMLSINIGINVTGYISGPGNYARLDSAYLTRRNIQTSQLGSGERPRMCTMQTARAVKDPCAYAEIRWSTDTNFSPNRSAAANATSTSYVLKTCDRIASSDWQNLFGIMPSVREKLGNTFRKSRFYCKDYRIITEWRTLKEKVLSVPFYGLEVPFSGPSSFKLATSDLIFGDKNLYCQTTACYFVLLELTI